MSMESLIHQPQHQTKDTKWNWVIAAGESVLSICSATYGVYKIIRSGWSDDLPPYLLGFAGLMGAVALKEWYTIAAEKKRIKKETTFFATLADALDRKNIAALPSTSPVDRALLERFYNAIKNILTPQNPFPIDVEKDKLIQEGKEQILGKIVPSLMDLLPGQEIAGHTNWDIFTNIKTELIKKQQEQSQDLAELLKGIDKITEFLQKKGCEMEFDVYDLLDGDHLFNPLIQRINALHKAALDFSSKKKPLTPIKLKKHLNVKA